VGLGTAAVNLDVEVPDLLAERVAVEPQEVGSPNLVAAGGCESGREQRYLDLLEDAMIEARRWEEVRLGIDF
jgi:hypothetical protein